MKNHDTLIVIIAETTYFSHIMGGYVHNFFNFVNIYEFSKIFLFNLLQTNNIRISA